MLWTALKQYFGAKGIIAANAAIAFGETFCTDCWSQGYIGFTKNWINEISPAQVLALPKGKVHFYQINQSELVNNIKYYSHAIKFRERNHLKGVDNSEFNWHLYTAHCVNIETCVYSTAIIKSELNSLLSHCKKYLALCSYVIYIIKAMQMSRFTEQAFVVGYFTGLTTSLH